MEACSFYGGSVLQSSKRDRSETTSIRASRNKKKEPKTRSAHAVTFFDETSPCKEKFPNQVRTHDSVKTANHYRICSV